MSYEVELSDPVKKALKAVQPNVRAAALERILALQSDPRPAGCLKLRAQRGWRIKAWKYRILYVIDDNSKLVQIYKFDKREHVYDDD